VGLFADGSFGEGGNGVSGPVRGLLFGDPGQLAASGCRRDCTRILFGLRHGNLFLSRARPRVGNPVAAEIETAGLDDLEMG